MSSKDELSNLLNVFGLSNYEQIVLLELYKLGPNRADVIAENTNMKLPRVYEALDSLVSKNFLTVKGSRPKIFSAKNPQISLSHTLENAKKEFDQQIEQMKIVASQLLDVMEPMYIKHHTDMLPEDLLSQFSNLVEAQTYTNQLIHLAKDEISIFTHVFNWFDNVKDDLKLAIERGVKVRVLMHTNFEESMEKLDAIKSLGIKVKTSPLAESNTRGTIVDDKYLIFVIWASENDSNKKKRIYRPHYSTNPGIISVFKGYFAHLWD